MTSPGRTAMEKQPSSSFTAPDASINL